MILKLHIACKISNTLSGLLLLLLLLIPGEWVSPLIHALLLKKQKNCCSNITQKFPLSSFVSADSACLLSHSTQYQPAAGQTFSRRIAVIQQVLVCSSSAQSSFKSRAELHFVDYREKKFRENQLKFMIQKLFFSRYPNRWRHLDAEAVVWRCSVQFFGSQDCVDITVTEAGKELQMPRFLQGSTNDV